MSQEKENRQHENAQSVQEGQQPHKRRVRHIRGGYDIKENIRRNLRRNIKNFSRRNTRIPFSM